MTSGCLPWTRYSHTSSLTPCFHLDAYKIQDSERVRVFAPIAPLLPRNNRKAGLPGNYKPSSEALRWHYNMCVIENMCASLLDTEGGAKRLPWREGPVLVQVADELVLEQQGGTEQQLSIAPRQQPPPPPPQQLDPKNSGQADREHEIVKRKWKSPSPALSLRHEDDENDQRLFVQELHRLLNREAAARKEREIVGA